MGNRRPRILMTTAAAALTLAFLPTGTTAIASSDTDLKDVVAEALPEHADRTDDSGTVTHADSQSRMAGTHLKVNPVNSEIPSFDIGLTGELNQDEDLQGYSVFTDSNTDDASLVRADPVGASFLDVTTDPHAGPIQDFTFNDTIASYRDNVHGDTVVTLENGESVVLQDSVSVDSNGRTLDSDISIDGNTVAVEVDAPESADAYPLVTASGFVYLMDFDIGYTDPATARTEMKASGMFDTIFPVQGAPEDFPEVGDLLPLYVAIDIDLSSFECTFGGDAFISDGPYNEWGYWFDATANHIDGEGSSIRFMMSGAPDEPDNTLAVYGDVMNNNPSGIPQSVYEIGARSMWSEFARRLEWLTLFEQG